MRKLEKRLRSDACNLLSYWISCCDSICNLGILEVEEDDASGLYVLALLVGSIATIAVATYLGTIEARTMV